MERLNWGGFISIQTTSSTEGKTCHFNCWDLQGSQIFGTVNQSDSGFGEKYRIEIFGRVIFTFDAFFGLLGVGGRRTKPGWKYVADTMGNSKISRLPTHRFPFKVVLFATRATSEECSDASRVAFH